MQYHAILIRTAYQSKNETFARDLQRFAHFEQSESRDAVGALVAAILWTKLTLCDTRRQRSAWRALARRWMSSRAFARTWCVRGQCCFRHRSPLVRR